MLFEGGLGDAKTKGLNIREPTNSCCCCIPINLGVKLIGIFVLIEAALAIWVTINFILHVKPFIGIVNGLLFLPLFLSGFYFYKWFGNDCADTRVKLPLACVYVTF